MPSSWRKCSFMLLCGAILLQFGCERESRHDLRWKAAIFVAVEDPKDDANSDNSGPVLPRIIENLSNMSDGLWGKLGPYLSYAHQLATLAGVQFRPATPGHTSNLLIRATSSVPEEARYGSSGVWTQTISKEDAEGERICAVTINSRNDTIVSAVIDIHGSVTESDAHKCFSELIWRSFGYVDDMPDGLSWIDEVMTPAEKEAWIIHHYKMLN